ncbi:ion channel domain-containing protein [Ditylenchus destructor]|nr:ion channel domain-containing protein [Ditylenchus destructor]
MLTKDARTPTGSTATPPNHQLISIPEEDNTSICYSPSTSSSSGCDLTSLSSNDTKPHPSFETSVSDSQYNDAKMHPSFDTSPVRDLSSTAHLAKNLAGIKKSTNQSTSCDQNKTEDKNSGEKDGGEAVFTQSYLRWLYGQPTHLSPAVHQNNTKDVESKQPDRPSLDETCFEDENTQIEGSMSPTSLRRHLFRRASLRRASKRSKPSLDYIEEENEKGNSHEELSATTTSSGPNITQNATENEPKTPMYQTPGQAGRDRILAIQQKRYRYFSDSAADHPPQRSFSLMISDFMTEHESVFHMIPTGGTGGGLFGATFQLDSKAMQRKIFNRKKPTVFQHLARFHNKFGMRHYIMVGLLALYSIAGGFMFQAIEAENERQNLELNRDVLQTLIFNMSMDIFSVTNVTPAIETRNDVILVIREYYREMLKAEGKYIGSVFHKYEQFTVRLSWYYGSAVFYAMTLFTTIGYGTMACQTVLGKTASVLYAMVGIPLMLVVLSDLGMVLLRCFTYIYNLHLRTWRRFKAYFRKKLFGEHPNDCPENNHRTVEKKFTQSSTGSSDSDENDEEEFPLYLAVIIVLIYLVFVSVVVTLFDYHDGHTPGLTFGDSFYFSFLSLSTIGLGDVMPNNIEYSPFLAILFLFGLSLLGVVNSTVYMKIEGQFLGIVDKIEDYLETVHYYRHGREGYFVFKSLGPNIQLLALALPIFDDLEEEKIEAMLEPENTKLGRKIFSTKQRSHSLVPMTTYIDQNPTLGIWNTNPPVQVPTPKPARFFLPLPIASRPLQSNTAIRKRGTIGSFDAGQMPSVFERNNIVYRSAKVAPTNDKIRRVQSEKRRQSSAVTPTFEHTFDDGFTPGMGRKTRAFSEIV